MLNNQDGMSEAGNDVVGLGTILILEDEVLVSILIEDLVRELGAGEVLTCSNAQQALEHVETSNVNCAILDVHLGRGTSFRVADALAARGIPFTFSSALGSVAVEERHRDRPMLSKPFTDDELRAQLLGLLRR